MRDGPVACHVLRHPPMAKILLEHHCTAADARACEAELHEQPEITMFYAIAFELPDGMIVHPAIVKRQPRYVTDCFRHNYPEIADPCDIDGVINNAIRCNGTLLFYPVNDD